jgi:hypothetical protein
MEMKHTSAFFFYFLMSCMLLFSSCDRFEDEPVPEKEDAFVKFFGGEEQQSGIQVLEVDNGFVILGRSNSFTGGGLLDNRPYLIFTDKEGNELFSQVYTQFGTEGLITTQAIEKTADGFALLITEIRDLGNDANPIIILTDETGNISGSEEGLVLNREGMTGTESMVANDLAVGEAGDLWVLATFSDSTTNDIRPFVFHRDVDNSILEFGEGFVTAIVNREGMKIITGRFQGEEAAYVLSNEPLTNDRITFSRISESGLGLPGGDFVSGVELINGLYSGVDVIRVGNGYTILAEYRSQANTIPRPFLMHVVETVDRTEIIWQEVVRPIPEVTAQFTGLALRPRSVTQTSSGGYAITGLIGENIDQGANIFQDQTDAVGRTTSFPLNSDNFTTIEGWPKVFGGENQDEGNDVISCSDGGIALTGSVTLEGDNAVVTLIKTNLQGELN